MGAISLTSRFFLFYASHPAYASCFFFPFTYSCFFPLHFLPSFNFSPPHFFLPFNYFSSSPLPSVPCVPPSIKRLLGRKEWRRPTGFWGADFGSIVTIALTESVMVSVYQVPHRYINSNKSMFSLVPRLSTRHCPHLLLSVVACYRSISPACGALSSKPAAHRCCCRSTGQTDGRTLDRLIDPVSHTMRAVSTTNTSVSNVQTSRYSFLPRDAINPRY